MLTVNGEHTEFENDCAGTSSLCSLVKITSVMWLVREGTRTRCGGGPHDTGQLTEKIIWNIVKESVAIVKSRENHCTVQSAAGIDSLELESKYLHSALKFSSYQFIFHFMF